MDADEQQVLASLKWRVEEAFNNAVEVARAHCRRALLIETAEEIRPADVQGVKRVGVGVGASTPDWAIKSVVERLREIAAEPNDHYC